MSMFLATTSSEIHRSRLFDSDNAPENPPVEDLSDVSGRYHYGQALSSLRDALQHGVKSSQSLEAIFVTLWLMVDYENRFGSGLVGINVHMRGIMSLLFNHVLPPLKYREALELPSSDEGGGAKDMLKTTDDIVGSNQLQPTEGTFNDQFRSTTVPLFLLWILYFSTPGAIFCSAQIARADDGNLFRRFLQSGSNKSSLTLPELYTISRQSPVRFWGEQYPASAQLDDLENLPGLNLYHKSHVIQFKITETFKRGHLNNPMYSSGSDVSTLRSLMDELAAVSEVGPGIVCLSYAFFS